MKNERKRRSEVGIGTTFKMLIPDMEDAGTTEEDLESRLMEGQGRILLFDDEGPIIRERVRYPLRNRMFVHRKHKQSRGA